MEMVAFIGILALYMGAQLWTRRKRREGNEDGGSTGRGAEAMIHGSMGTGGPRLRPPRTRRVLPLHRPSIIGAGDSCVASPPGPVTIGPHGWDSAYPPFLAIAPGALWTGVLAHQAKGLEWEQVLLLERDLTTSATRRNQLDQKFEQHRKTYVALTRARRYVRVLKPLNMAPHGVTRVAISHVDP